MSVADAFAPDVSAREFIEDHLEDLIEPHAELYEKVSDVDLVIRLVLAGDGGGEWTLVVSDLGIDVEQGRTSTPLISLLGDATAWPHMRESLGKLAAAGDHALRKHGDDLDVPDDKRLTNARLNRLEGVQGWVELVMHNLSDAREEAKMDVVLNGDAPSGKPLRVDVDLPAVVAAAGSRSAMLRLVKEGKVRVGGDMGLSVRLMGALA